MIAVIEHLPQELRDRFTEMREMDLGVQSMYLFVVTDNNNVTMNNNNNKISSFQILWIASKRKLRHSSVTSKR